ncbi:hypothetical protein GCM10018954_047040 [Kutzneria kofuensis]
MVAGGATAANVVLGAAVAVAMVEDDTAVGIRQSVDGIGSATGSGGGELVARKISTEPTSAPVVAIHTINPSTRGLSRRLGRCSKGSIARAAYAAGFPPTVPDLGRERQS